MKPKLNLIVTGVLLLVVLAIAPVTKADNNGSVSGCITDSRSGAPIVGAWVAVVENNLGASTDSAGCFRIDNLPAGEYNLVVTHPIYGTVRGLTSMKVVVKSGKKVSTSIELNPTVEKAVDKEEQKDKDDGIFDRLKEAVGGAEYSPRFEAQESGAASGENFAHINRSPKVGASKRLPEPANYYPNWDRPQMPPHDMYFRDYGTNGFTDTRRDRYSTFALDVDDASYTLAREYLLNGTTVPSDAVRVEEFINHFDYGYNIPGRDKFRVFAELTDSPFDGEMQVMKIAVKAREHDRGERRPFNITFVIDKSGSMNQGNRFDLVRESVKRLVQGLGTRDRVGVVAYGSNAFVVLEPVSADRRDLIYRAIDRIRPDGSTYAEGGIRLGYEMANRQYHRGDNNLVILCSDGVANVGHTSPDAIMRDIEDYARRGISLNSYGYGMGNYNDVLLEQLAQQGDGQYAYVNSYDDVSELFGSRLLEQLEVVARDVKVQVEFNPQIVQSYRLLGYENRDVADHRFRDDRQDGGELFSGHEVTAVYELYLRSDRTVGGKVADVFVRWKEADGGRADELKREVLMGRDYQRLDQARPELRLAIVAGRFAEMVKGTPYSSRTGWGELLHAAEMVERDLPGEQTRELVDLIQRAGRMDHWRADDWRYEKDYRGEYGNYKR